MRQIDKQNQRVGINLIISFISIQYLYRGRGKGGEERREGGCKLNEINEINNIYNNINHLHGHFFQHIAIKYRNLIKCPISALPEASL